MNTANLESELALRRRVMERLYDAYLRDGLYRGVVSRKEIAAELQCEEIALERNLEYLLDRELIRMHKIEDLVSISTGGIDYVEQGDSDEPGGRVAGALERIEKLLSELLSRLENRS